MQGETLDAKQVSDEIKSKLLTKLALPFVVVHANQIIATFWHLDNDSY
jgi:hypothetical protein